MLNVLILSNTMIVAYVALQIKLFINLNFSKLWLVSEIISNQVS